MSWKAEISILLRPVSLHPKINLHIMKVNIEEIAMAALTRVLLASHSSNTPTILAGLLLGVVVCPVLLPCSNNVLCTQEQLLPSAFNCYSFANLPGRLSFALTLHPEGEKLVPLRH